MIDEDVQPKTDNGGAQKNQKIIDENHIPACPIVIVQPRNRHEQDANKTYYQNGQYGKDHYFFIHTII